MKLPGRGFMTIEDLSLGRWGKFRGSLSLYLLFFKYLQHKIIYQSNIFWSSMSCTSTVILGWYILLPFRSQSHNAVLISLAFLQPQTLLTLLLCLKHSLAFTFMTFRYFGFSSTSQVILFQLLCGLFLLYLFSSGFCLGLSSCISLYSPFWAISSCSIIPDSPICICSPVACLGHQTDPCTSAYWLSPLQSFIKSVDF